MLIDLVIVRKVRSNLSLIFIPSSFPFIMGEVPTGAIDGANVDYSAQYAFVFLEVYLNGLRLKETDDYIISGDDSFSLVQAALIGDSVMVNYIRA